MKRPTKFSDLIGPAGKAGKILEPVIARMKASADANEGGYLFYGPPGVGKTSLAEIMALRLAEDPLSITQFSGLDVNVSLVREWQNNIGTGNLFGDWQVRLVEELDRVPRDAQDLLLYYLDKIRGRRVCFIGTSNMQLDLLQERFQTRLRPFKIMAPETGELTGLLKLQGLDEYTAGMIAVGSGGNVRAALLDARNALDAQLVAA